MKRSKVDSLAGSAPAHSALGAVARRSRWPIAPLVVATALLGCEGVIGDLGSSEGSDPSGPGGPGGPDDPGTLLGPDGEPLPPGAVPPGGVAVNSASLCEQLGDGIHSGPSPMRRLNRFEYNNTVRDLIGDSTRPATSFSPEETALGFDNNATVLGVTTLLAEQFSEAAAALAEAATNDISSLLPCDPAGNEDTCARDFIESFGQRAFRRPLSQEEVDGQVAVYEWGRDNLGFEQGIEMVVETLLQSSNFLYRPELGTTVVEGDVVRLTDWEMASRLSYLFWGSMPDDELFAAAEAGQLQNGADILAQATRMLDDDRARERVANFHAQWLELEQLDDLERDPSQFPGYTANTPALMRSETEAFIDHVVWQGGGSAKTFFTAPYTFMNGELASFYGVGGPTGSELVRTDMDPSRSAGLLTHSGILALHSKANQSSPVHRGKFVRERLLCHMLQPPPDNIIIEVPDLDPNLTTRERFAAHSEGPCAQCHRLMDPIGLGFENFDAVGRWRDTENGLPIDASGEVFDADVEGPFDGPAELGDKLSQSEEAMTCIVTNWARYAYGRSETPDDACTLDHLKQEFSVSGYDVRSLLLALTQTDAFLYRKAGAQ